MNRSAQLFPRMPRKMKQPTKDVLRDHLARAASEIERLGRIVEGVKIALLRGDYDEPPSAEEMNNLDRGDEDE